MDQLRSSNVIETNLLHLLLPDAPGLRLFWSQVGHKSELLGSIRTEHDWDAVLMVLLDHEFNALEIYEAQRPEIVTAFKEPRLNCSECARCVERE